MGLRFRKSISLFPGVRLNFGKTGASVSLGVPGIHKTFHANGKTTTSIGIPGTGLSWVTTENEKSNRSTDDELQSNTPRSNSPELNNFYLSSNPTQPYQNIKRPNERPQIDNERLRRIHAVADEPVDWTNVLVNSEPPDQNYDKDKWAYYHGVAEAVLAGDIDTFLMVIQDVNPFNDLLEFGSGFDFGTDDPKEMTIEFQIRSAEVMPNNFSNNELYNSLLQDYVCSTTLRIARDTLSLLPVQRVIVHAEDLGSTILSVIFDRLSMNKLNFRFTDPSDAMNVFRHNMSFSLKKGFSPVERIE